MYRACCFGLAWLLAACGSNPSNQPSAAAGGSSGGSSAAAAGAHAIAGMSAGNEGGGAGNGGASGSTAGASGGTAGGGTAGGGTAGASAGAGGTSGAATHGGAASGAFGGNDAGGQGAAGAQPCNELANVGLDVKGTTAPGAFPSVGGHTVPADGVYVLTSSIWYANTTPSNQIRKRTLMIHGKEMQAVTSENYGPDQRVNFTINPLDKLNQVPTCGLETDWTADKEVAWGMIGAERIDIREPYGMWSYRIDTYTHAK